MKISKNTIDKIFEAVIIEDVISDFVNLKKTGANYKGLSPFNDEKTPSFVVSPSKEIWKDFSSGKGGNVISFLMEHEQYTYPEALLFLAEKYNIHVEYIEISSKDQEQESERQATILVLNFVKNLFVKNLFKKEKGLHYLQSRGFNKSTLEQFEIGYCDKSDNTISEETKKSGYNIKYLFKTRIINEKGDNRFRGRIMFPIHGLTGDVLGFGGRILNTQLKAVKYLNSDSSDLYQKSKILYGMHLAKKYIKKLDFCYIVEGYTDVIALFQFGIKNVVSSCGTALTKDQIRLMHRFTKNIVILFDSDHAGIHATLKAIDQILIQGMTPKILQLPNGEDPASFIYNNEEKKIHAYFQKHTIGFIAFKLGLRKNDTPGELINITKSIMSSIALIEDPISKTFYTKEISKKIGVKEDHLLQDLENQPIRKKFEKNSDNSNQDNELDVKYIEKFHLEELQLIRLFINYGTVNSVLVNNSKISVSEFILLELQKDNKDINIKFSIPLFNEIIDDIKEKINSNEEVSKDYFLNHLNSNFRFLSSCLIGEKHLLSNWHDKDIIVTQEKDILYKVTTESILRFKLKRIQEMIKTVLVTLKDSEDNNNLTVKKFTKLSKIEKKIQQKLGRIF